MLAKWSRGEALAARLKVMGFIAGGVMDEDYRRVQYSDGTTHLVIIFFQWLSNKD